MVLSYCNAYSCTTPWYYPVDQSLSTAFSCSYPPTYPPSYHDIHSQAATPDPLEVLLRSSYLEVLLRASSSSVAQLPDEISASTLVICNPPPPPPPLLNVLIEKCTHPRNLFYWFPILLLLCMRRRMRLLSTRFHTHTRMQRAHTPPTYTHLTSYSHTVSSYTFPRENDNHISFCMHRVSVRHALHAGIFLNHNSRSHPLHMHTPQHVFIRVSNAY
jgi:hypothetical protein